MIARRVLAIAMGCCLGGLLSEVVFRVGFPGNTQPATFVDRVTETDPDLIYRLRPGRFEWPKGPAFTVQENGRRGMEFRSLSDQRAWTLACLGDSSTMGYGVGDEEHYPYVLGERLFETTALPLEVQNFGVLGYTSRQGATRLEREVLKRNPDAVLIALGYNDTYLTLRDEESWYASMASRSWFPHHVWLRTFSHVYRTFWHRTHRVRNHALPATRIRRAEFEQNLRSMISRVRENGRSRSSWNSSFQPAS